MVLARLHQFGNKSIFDRSLRKGQMWTFEEWNPSCGTDWLKRFVPTSDKLMFASRAWREVLTEQQKEAKLIRDLSQKEQARKEASSKTTIQWGDRFKVLLREAINANAGLKYPQQFKIASDALMGEKMQFQREKGRAAAKKHNRYLSLMAAAKTHDVGVQRRRRRAEKKKLAKEYRLRQAEETLKANKAKLAKKRAKKARKKSNRRAREAQQALDDPMDVDFVL